MRGLNRRAVEATTTLDDMLASGHKVMTKHYDSMGEFITELDSRPGIHETRFGKCETGRAWHGARSMREAMQIVKSGIPKFRAEIDTLVSKVSVSLPSEQDAWVADVAGCCPIVPAAIAGLPDNMLRLEKQPTSDTPLRVYVSVAYSGGCEQHMIERRGVAILALLESIAAKRPVELLLFGELDDRNCKGLHTPVVRVDSMPLDQSTLTAALVSPVVLRVLFMAWCESNPDGFGGSWAWGGMAPTHVKAQEFTRQAIGARPEDLVIFAAFLTESDEIIRDPLGWVQKQIKLTEDNLANR